MLNKTLTKTLIIFCLVALVSAFMIFPVLASDPYGLNKTADAAKLPTGTTDVSTIVGYIVGALLSLMGVIFLVLVIFGGILWMTAEGNSEKVTKAINILKNAAIGLIIVLAAYSIVFFVLDQLVTAVGIGGSK